MTYVVAVYEIDRAWGGHEEGGWWYDCGTLRRILAATGDEERARAFSTRANRLLGQLQSRKRPVSSLAYEGGRHAVMVFRNIAPPFFPEQRPHYE